MQKWIDSGRLNPDEKITMATLRLCGLCSKITKSYEKGVKLLGRGSDVFAAKLNIEVCMMVRRRRKMTMTMTMT